MLAACFGLESLVVSSRFVVLLRVRDDTGTDCGGVVGVVLGDVVQSTFASLSLLNTRASASFHVGIGGSFRCGLIDCTGSDSVGAGDVVVGGVVWQSVLSSSLLLKTAASASCQVGICGIFFGGVWYCGLSAAVSGDRAASGDGCGVVDVVVGDGIDVLGVVAGLFSLHMCFSEFKVAVHTCCMRWCCMKSLASFAVPW